MNASDIGYVQKNYLLENQSVENAPMAKKDYIGKSLERILEELGIQ
jgi:hypothetical protein